MLKLKQWKGNLRRVTSIFWMFSSEYLIHSGPISHWKSANSNICLVCLARARGRRTWRGFWGAGGWAEMIDAEVINQQKVRLCPLLSSVSRLVWCGMVIMCIRYLSCFPSAAVYKVFLSILFKNGPILILWFPSDLDNCCVWNKINIPIHPAQHEYQGNCCN